MVGPVFFSDRWSGWSISYYVSGPTLNAASFAGRLIESSTRLARA